jgi:hypothetical protein
MVKVFHSSAYLEAIVFSRTRLKMRCLDIPLGPSHTDPGTMEESVNERAPKEDRSHLSHNQTIRVVFLL